MKKYLSICLYSFLVHFSSFSQTNIDEKYIFYRNRFENFFIKKGEIPEICISPENLSEFGLSMPASTIDVRENGESIYPHFGDVNQDIGWYMAVLATEYELKKNEGMDVGSTLYDLYCTMLTIRAEDAMAEKYRYPGHVDYVDRYNCEENGFFIRASTPKQNFEKYWRNTKSINGKFLSNEYFESEFKDYYESKFKEYMPLNEQGEHKEADKWASLDHFTQLMLGFAFIKRYMKDVEYKGQKNYFYNQAKSFTDRVMNHAMKTDWNYFIPNTDKKVSSVDEGWGGSAQYGSSYMVSQAAKWITDKNYEDQYTFITNIVSDEFQTPGIANLVPLLIKNKFSTFGDKDFSMNLIQNWAAVGSPWRAGYENVKVYSLDFCYPSVKPNCGLIGRKSSVDIRCLRYRGNDAIKDYIITAIFGAEYSKIVSSINEYKDLISGKILVDQVCVYNAGYPYFNYSINTTEHVLHDYWSTYSQSQIYALINTTLHKNDDWYTHLPPIKSYAEQRKVYYNILNSAPCRGLTNNPDNGWGSTNRFVITYSKIKDEAYCNGLDYMLLYNLYKLNFGDKKYPISSNFKDELDFNYRLLGKDTYVGLNKIGAKNSVLISSNSKFLSTGIIDLNESFDTRNAQNIDFKIDYELKCSTENVTGRSTFESSKTTNENSHNENEKNIDFKKYSYIEIDKYLEQRKGIGSQIAFNKSLVYPNPSNTTLNIELSKEISFYDIKIFDSQGVEILESSFENAARNIVNEKKYLTCNIENWKSGLYIIRINNNNSYENIKFIKY